ncbi:MAG: PDZ domain-containing protein [Thermoanaerobaculia bacterium]|nr:PDZ domain-containing protein [Thermoanaerobaculia bacterium]
MKRIRSISCTLHSAVVLASLSLTGCSSMVTHFGGGLSEDLQQNGVAARARIEEIWDTGWTINDNPVIGMKVLVLPPDRPAFTATIEKTTVSRIGIPQFQPGNTVPVRFDPGNPAVVAIDFGGSESAESASGNPYRDRFAPTALLGANFLPPPASPELYLGTADSAADLAALFENDYSLLGGSRVENGSNPEQALEQGRAIGAALVVVYGHFSPPPGKALEVLPFRPRPVDPDSPAAKRLAGPGAEMLVSGLGPDDQFAAYWGKTRPAILGIVSRPLSADEQARLRREDGIVVESVANGSPAAFARIAPGDVLIAIDGEPFGDVTAVPALVTSLAGRRVGIDLIRDGRPYSVMVQLNPAAP